MLTALLHARPRLNCNTPQDFVDAAVAVTEAEAATRRAFRLLKSDVVHGRNYQHLDIDECNTAITHDINVVSPLLQQADALKALALALIEAAADA